MVILAENNICPLLRILIKMIYFTVPAQFTHRFLGFRNTSSDPVLASNGSLLNGFGGVRACCGALAYCSFPDGLLC